VIDHASYPLAQLVPYSTSVQRDHYRSNLVIPFASPNQQTRLVLTSTG
jgi:hypothetical protein